jgi:hypothetical protein
MFNLIISITLTSNVACFKDIKYRGNSFIFNAYTLKGFAMKIEIKL